MTPDTAIRIARLQQRVFRCIEDCLREDGHHKSYEGAMEVSLEFPNFFEQHRKPIWSISLHCYLICDGRHDEWTGETLEEALAKAEAKINEYCQPYEMKRFERDMGMCDDTPEEAAGEATVYGPKRGDGSLDDSDNPF